MNLGFNASLPLALGSGTIAAATEGALAGIPSFAFSLALESQDFAKVSAARGHRDEEGNAITRRAAERATQIVTELLRAPAPPYSVHNINFPPRVEADAPLTRTELALSEIPSLFAPVMSDTKGSSSLDAPRRYTFSFASKWRYTHNPESSDVRALKRGEISHTLIRWDHISTTD
jgi:5'/3'-nucleotidase SurE